MQTSLKIPLSPWFTLGNFGRNGSGANPNLRSCCKGWNGLAGFCSFWYTLAHNMDRSHRSVQGATAAEHGATERGASLDEGKSGTGNGVASELVRESWRQNYQLGNEAAEIEVEIGKVGDALSSRMTVLQSKAADIGNMVETSLDKKNSF
ncbi:hypothetical protein SASPL_137576 [Salvia splendens]|uniref:Uncharacterized protein n=1 Tax=Salvia splendens TaxID=180675 RepID=A0A8X8WV38_SALSN|nr:hypothetical protein SASPL_137576 [Salvia splendens]